MKKMILGGMLLFCGFTGTLVLLCISIFKPWSYNGIQGIEGFLLGTHLKNVFVFYCIIGLGGLILCTFDVVSETLKAKKK
jgi:hypothetical protein